MWPCGFNVAIAVLVSGAGDSPVLDRIVSGLRRPNLPVVSLRLAAIDRRNDAAVRVRCPDRAARSGFREFTNDACASS